MSDGFIMTCTVSILSLGAFATLSASSAREIDDQPMNALAFLIGDWQATSEIYPEAYGPQGAGTSAGTVVAKWGAQHAWLTADFASVLPVGGPYAVHVVVHYDHRSSDYIAYVVNTFRSGVLYRGKLEAPGKVVFTGQVGSKWQRVTYRELPNDQVEFLVEDADIESGPYRRHSRATCRSATAE
jgi:hypothetical protein